MRNQSELRKQESWCGWSTKRGSGTARDEDEDQVRAQSKQDSVGLTSRSFYSKNKVKIMKGFKHEGDMITIYFLKITMDSV